MVVQSHDLPQICHNQDGKWLLQQCRQQEGPLQFQLIWWMVQSVKSHRQDTTLHWMADISDCSLYWQSVGTGKVKKTMESTPLFISLILFLLKARSRLQIESLDACCMIYRSYSPYLPSLLTLKDWWDKSDVTRFLRRLTSDKNLPNCGQVCLF